MGEVQEELISVLKTDFYHFHIDLDSLLKKSKTPLSLLRQAN